MTLVPGTRAVHLRDKPPTRIRQKAAWFAQAGFRGDLEGLRAVAVIAVIAEHLTLVPRAGFVGVDVFFVLSGFLITSLLLREHARTGKISFGAFYRKRIRRILPVATLVLVVTVVVSYLVFRAARAAGIFQDALWAALFTGNWQQALNGNDYMAAGASKSPLEHYWSLGVEEQFYLLWPVILVALFWLAAKSGIFGRSRLRVLCFGLGLLVFVSFAYSVLETSTNPSVAYFDTLGRAWELGAGGLLAALFALFPRLEFIGLRLRFVLTWLGLGAIVASMFWLSPESAFPGPWALMPVVGTLAVIAGGAGTPGLHFTRGMAVLTNPVSRYIGRISFSLYLWHFPVIVFLQALMPHQNGWFYVLAVALTLALSALSFHFVENPVRRSQWLETSIEPAGRRFLRTSLPGRSRAIGLGAFAAVVLLIAGGMVFNSNRASAPVESLAPTKAASPAVIGVPDGVTPAPTNSALPRVKGPAVMSVLNNPNASIAQNTAITSALASSTWPALTPDLDQFNENGADVKAPQWVRDGCLGAQPMAKSTNLEVNAQDCVYGDPHGTHTLILYGDSVAMSYLPGILEATKDQGWKVRVLTVAGCPVAAVDQSAMGGAPFPECNTFRQWAVKQITETKPDLVVVSEYRNDLVLSSKATGAPADAERAAGLKATFSQLAEATAPVLYLAAPPDGKILAECATTVSKPQDCVAQPTPLYLRNLVIERTAVDEFAGNRATFVDTQSWFCAGNQCPSFIGNTPMHADQFHLTAAGSQEISPLLADAINVALSK